MAQQKNIRLSHEREYKDCDICGFRFHKDELHQQRGFLVCSADYDSTDETEESD